MNFPRSAEIPSLAVWIGILSLVLSVAGAGAQQALVSRSYDKNGKTRMEVESVFSPNATRGFLPVRVTIRNATLQDRNWRVDFRFRSTWGELGYGSSFVVAAGSGEEVVRELLVPVPTSISSGSSYRQLNVSVASAGLPSVNQTDSFQSSSGWPSIAISKSLADRNLNSLNGEVSSRSSAGTDVFGATFLADDLPGDWRGYTSLDVLMMAEEEWEALAPGPRLAILEWTRLGGRLDLYTRESQPATWLKETGLVGDGAADRNRGLGSIRAWNWNGRDLGAKELVKRYLPVGNLARHLAEEYQKSWPLLDSLGGKNFNAVLVVLLLVAFGIVVGPINLFVLAKPGRRHRLFITTPIISLVASLLIMALILLSDGIGGSGRRVLLAALEPGAEEKRLYVVQEQISRSGVLLGTGFRIGEPVFLSQVMLPRSAWNRFDTSSSEVGSFSLEGATYRGDWFQSRSEQAHYLQSVRPTRSRIERRAAGDGETPPKLFSSLEFTLDQFFYRDPDGRVWRSTATGAISGGQEIPLAASDNDALEKWWKEQTTKLSAPLRRSAASLPRENGRFFAVTGDLRAGFVETLGSIRWKEDVALIHGAVLNEVAGGMESESSAEQ